MVETSMHGQLSSDHSTEKNSLQLYQLIQIYLIQIYPRKMDADSITLQLLELTKRMQDSGKQFHLALTIKDASSEFTFSTGSQDRPKMKQKKKPKSPRLQS